MDKEEIVIPASRTKIVLLIAGSLVFIALSFWLWSVSMVQTRQPTAWLKAISLSGIVFFGLCAIVGIRKLFDTKPGLLINDAGILDHSSALSGHLIPWADIMHLEMYQIKRVKFLLIFVRNPTDFYRHSNFFKKFMMRMNHNIYGTPLSISSASLKCNFDTLSETIQMGLDKHNPGRNPTADAESDPKE